MVLQLEIGKKINQNKRIIFDFYFKDLLTESQDCNEPTASNQILNIYLQLKLCYLMRGIWMDISLNQIWITFKLENQPWK